MFSTRIKDSLCEFNNLLFQMKSKQTHEPRLSNKSITYRQNHINTFQPSCQTAGADVSMVQPHTKEMPMASTIQRPPKKEVLGRLDNYNIYLLN